MSTDTYKAFIDDALLAMCVDQLRSIIVKISDTNLEEVGKAVLAERGAKEKKLMEKDVGKGIREEIRIAKKVVSKTKPTKKAVPPKKRGRKRVVPLVPPTFSRARGFSDLGKREVSLLHLIARR